MPDLRSVVDDFTQQLTTIITAQVNDRARAAVEAALNGSFTSTRRGPGRPPKALVFAASGRRRRKAPIQLCPVPGCKNRAAPVYGMVCADHKDVAKAKIKKYREARRAKQRKQN
jgi:hypothetical protein